MSRIKQWSSKESPLLLCGFPLGTSAAKLAVSLTLEYPDLLKDCQRLGDISAFKNGALTVIDRLNGLWGENAVLTTGGFCSNDCSTDVIITVSCMTTAQGSAEVTMDIFFVNLEWVTFFIIY